MGESTPSLGSRLRGAAVVLVLAIGLPILAMLPWGDGTLLTPAVLVAAFGLVCALNAGWRRTLALVPVLVVGTVLGSLTAGTSAWPWLAGALGALVGLSTRAGLAAPAVLAALALYLCLVLTRPMWLSTALSTTAVLLLLDPTAGAGAAGTRLGAAVAAGVLGVAAVALLTVLGRVLPTEAREVAEETSRAQRVAPVA